ncbi:CG14538 [Drosophila busckii]|uniref:CG14538 n=1 Tax=Drosophila busckii TaxID=30019 RepID=A0A0M4E5L8_DROBS|nr:CG14538 [Drosophila busckii]
MARLVFTEKDHNAYDPKKYRVVHKNHWRQVSLRLAPTQKKWWEDPDVIVAEWLLPVVAAGGGKCTTVTMLLAQRIARNDCWSVDDERLHHSNKMNVWQTLEYLSGLSQRKRFNYDGFADTQNLIRTLTPSWRRDSFAEKAKAEALAGAAVVAAAAGDKYAHEPAAASVVLGKSLVSEHSSDNLTLTLRGAAVAAAAVLPRRKRRSRRKKCQTRVLTAEYALTSEDLQDLVKCTFNLPRISARLERLMGTNVVKLTDRAYMKELRERIDEDYRRKLLARIKAREIREVERERLLIIEGKTNIIPEELADDPIFMVNKDANIEIQKERSKLKTSREKNAERLKLQGVKWERERLQHAAKEAELLAKKHERQRQQKLLVEQYRMEDAERGMDLLRQKFRETELRIRNQLDDSKKEVKTTTAPTELDLFEFDDTGGDIDAPRERSASFGDYPGAIQIKYMDDASDVSEESVKSESLISLSVAKQQYAEVLQEEMDEEFNRGLLISKQQYDQLRYEDEKIVALRNAKNILELYQLAEEIITGGPVEEEEHGEEGDEEAVQEKTEPHSSDDDGGE